MRKTVLIVEDSPLCMKLFSDLLDVQGHAALRARGGWEAIRLARKHRPDLILMDIKLPDISGLEATQQLKQDPQLSGIPVIAVTAFAMPTDEDEIRRRGCDGYLAKPVFVTRFWETIERFLDHAGSSVAVARRA